MQNLPYELQYIIWNIYRYNLMKRRRDKVKAILERILAFPVIDGDPFLFDQYFQYTYEISEFEWDLAYNGRSLIFQTIYFRGRPLE